MPKPDDNNGHTCELRDDGAPAHSRATCVVCVPLSWDERGSEDDDTLGPCGCTDYHMSDCPTRTGYGVMEWGNDYDDDPDPYRGYSRGGW